MKSYEQLRNEAQEANDSYIYECLEKYLEEKLLIVGGGKNHGQAVILAGGAGSGKSFAVTKFMEGEKFKVINPDDIKDILLTMRDKKVVPQSETTASLLKRVANLKLKNPEDAGTLHMMIKDLGIDSKREVLLFAGKRESGLLPNVMFDATLKKPEHLYGSLTGEQGYLNLLKGAGYKPENIHIVWILTNYNLAVRQNLTRNRVVRTDILIKSHQGAADTMTNYVLRNYTKLGVNGDVAVILGGANNTVLYKKGDKVKAKDGREYILTKDTAVPVIKDFTYFRVKRAGENKMNQDALESIYKWVKRMAPPPDVDIQAVQDKAVADLKKKGKLDPEVAKYLGYEP